MKPIVSFIGNAEFLTVYFALFCVWAGERSSIVYMSRVPKNEAKIIWGTGDWVHMCEDTGATTSISESRKLY